MFCNSLVSKVCSLTTCASSRTSCRVFRPGPRTSEALLHVSGRTFCVLGFSLILVTSHKVFRSLHLWELSGMWMESTLYPLPIGALANDHKLSDTHIVLQLCGSRSGCGPHLAGIQVWATLHSFLEALAGALGDG